MNVRFERQVPPGLAVRPPTLADVQAVADLRNSVHRDEIGTDFTDPHEIRGYWTAPGVDLARDELLVFNGTGTLVGQMSVYTREPFTRIELDGFVRPDHVGGGVGTLLLAFAEGRGAEVARRAPAEETIALLVAAWKETGPAHDFFLARGYRPVRRFDDMKIVMDGPPPEPGWPDGITMRTFVSGVDDRAVFEGAEEAFQDHYGWTPASFDEWRHEEIDTDPHFDADLWFLAMDRDTIVGSCLCRTGRPEDLTMGWVGDLSVRRPWRRRGIALALLHHAFGEFHRRGVRRVGLGVDSESLTGANRLYERAGMQPYRSFLKYQKDLAPGGPGRA
ncbi:MAG: GNAT family N-acetyltransferase [Actinomycetota bacterium]